MRTRVKCQNFDVGYVVKVKFPVGRAPFLKCTPNHTVVKLFKNALKLNDGEGGRGLGARDGGSLYEKLRISPNLS